MEISKQIGLKTNYPTPGATPKDKGIDTDVLSVFMNKDAVSISSPKNDPDVAAKEWYVPMSEPKMQNLLKGKGLDGGSSQPVEISIIHTNDEHDSKFSRVAGEAAVVKSREKFHGDENSAIVNTGDVSYDGSNDKPGARFFGPMADVFNAMGVEYFVPGNHEFQHGGKYLEEKFLPLLDAQTLLGNVTYSSGKKPLEHTKPYAIQELNGVKVGFIGLTTPRQATSAHPEVGNDVNVQSLKTAAEKLIPQAKAEGAEIIVVLAHESVNPSSSLASSVAGIDIIVSGHDHATLQSPKTVRNPDGRNTLVIEAGSSCKYVGDMTLEVDPKSKEILGVNYKLYPTDGVKADPEVSAILQKYKNGQ